jgi:dimethylargininase
MASERGIALVRRPSPRLAEGIVTYIHRTPVDVELAQRQHAAYVDALAAHGWRIHPVPPADECPDSAFVEDTTVVCGDLAVVTRPGADVRQPETVAVAETLRALGLTVATIEQPGTLDGGDVLQVGTTLYIGHGGRTNDEGIRQLAEHVAPRGRSVVAVPLEKVLHLKSAVTALPDGTVLTWGDLVDPAPFPQRLAVPEESGAHVVPIGGTDLLIAASAPATAKKLADLGYTPVVVDISEFERLEGCVTCLNVLIPTAPGGTR